MKKIGIYCLLSDWEQKITQINPSPDNPKKDSNFAPNFDSFLKIKAFLKNYQSITIPLKYILPIVVLLLFSLTSITHTTWELLRSHLLYQNPQVIVFSKNDKQWEEDKNIILSSSRGYTVSFLR
jgi:hypothetical protein